MCYDVVDALCVMPSWTHCVLCRRGRIVGYAVVDALCVMPSWTHCGLCRSGMRIVSAGHVLRGQR